MGNIIPHKLKVSFHTTRFRKSVLPKAVSKPTAMRRLLRILALNDALLRPKSRE